MLREQPQDAVVDKSPATLGMGNSWGVGGLHRGDVQHGPPKDGKRLSARTCPSHFQPIESPDHYIWCTLWRGLCPWYLLGMKDLGRKQGTEAKRMSAQNVQQKKANELVR